MGGGPFGLQREAFCSADQGIRDDLLQRAKGVELVVTPFAHRILLMECVVEGSSIGIIVLHAYCLIDALILQISSAFVDHEEPSERETYSIYWLTRILFRIR